MSNKELVLYIEVEGYKGFYLATYSNIQNDVLNVTLKDLTLQFRCGFEDLISARSIGAVLDCTKLKRLN